MRDRSAIEGDGNAYGRGRSGDYNNEVKDGVLNVDIGGLFNNKSW